jgi:hypothetical protein
LAWALLRPSAIASAKLANSTVNHSQILMAAGWRRPDRQRHFYRRHQYLAMVYRAVRQLCRSDGGPSAIASAKLANSTVNHSQILMAAVKVALPVRARHFYRRHQYLAMVYRAVRQLCRSDGGRPQQSPGLASAKLANSTVNHSQILMAAVKVALPVRAPPAMAMAQSPGQ